MNNVELLDLYKAEKAALYGPLEPFPSFKTWKEEYMIEYRETHQTKDAKEAIDESDKIVELAEQELDGMKTKAKRAEPTPPTRAHPQRRAIPKTTKLASKTQIAQKIFTSMYPDSSRKDIIAKFVQTVGLTPAGASTYYQKFKKGAGAGGTPN